jgi:DNA-binding transcriptional ArsR family regulator
VQELAKPLAMSLPAVSKHLRMLQRAGLISQGRDAQWRPCRLERAPLDKASGWIEEQRKVWEGRLDRLEDYLRQLQNNEEGKS